MKGLKGLIAFIAMCGSVGLRAQIWGSSEPPQKVDTIETSDFRRMDPVLISGSMDEERKKEYQILKRRVIKTMPYAKMAAMKMRAMEDKLNTIENRKERKNTSSSVRQASNRCTWSS